ncbi:hypothetical protein LY78DRAFT_38362 [Colletotrichum sublineola]|nr:hypothetical protein LY78DRAFT_38362 [Colletotrichum sublineola]
MAVCMCITRWSIDGHIVNTKRTECHGQKPAVASPSQQFISPKTNQSLDAYQMRPGHLQGVLIPSISLFTAPYGVFFGNFLVESLLRPTVRQRVQTCRSPASRYVGPRAAESSSDANSLSLARRR